jgi:DNA-binding CsgD family transcriptional regulator
MPDEDQLLDRIYEAGAVPELWPDLLEIFGKIAETDGGVLFSARDGAVHWAASNGLADLIKGYMERGYLGNDDRTARLMAADHAGFLTESDVFAENEWEADPIRREYFAPRGYGWGIATGIKVPNGDVLVLHGERKLSEGPVPRAAVGRLDRLRPHFARAALMSSRVAFERVKGAVAALETVGIPAAVIDDAGRTTATNALLDEMTPDVVMPRRVRIALADPAADAVLQTAVDTLCARQAIEAPQSIPVAAREGRPPMVVHVHPVRRSARDVFSNSLAIVLVTPVTVRDMPSAALLQGLFDLTPAEAKVASAIGGGKTITQIAAGSGASASTIRNQVRSVFTKTGLHRQSDLVGLLQGVSVPKSAVKK